MSTIVITGAAGKIGSALRPRLAGHELRLTDIVPLAEAPRANETYTAASLADEDVLAELASGADLIVHLGGVLTDRTWAETSEVNITGTFRVLEAARRAGVRRMFYASSNHAVGYTPVADIPAGPVRLMAIRPDSFYGVAKAAAEALCSQYCDEQGMSILSARILTFAERPSSLRHLATWISPDDTARLVLTTLGLAGPGHRVVWGVSANTRGWVDLAEGRALGFDPQDDAEDYAAEILRTATDQDKEQLVAIGGRIAPVELERAGTKS